MKIKNVLSAFLIAALIAVSTGGCNVTDLGSDSLLRPPKTMGDEAEIEQLIADTAKHGYTLKYPKSGSYRSAIIMSDLDGDGVDEAVPFTVRERMLQGYICSLCIRTRMSGNYRLTT